MDCPCELDNVGCAPVAAVGKSRAELPAALTLVRAVNWWRVWALCATCCAAAFAYLYFDRVGPRAPAHNLSDYEMALRLENSRLKRSNDELLQGNAVLLSTVGWLPPAQPELIDKLPRRILSAEEVSSGE